MISLVLDTRTAVEDDEIDGFHIPAGTLVGVNELRPAPGPLGAPRPASTRAGSRLSARAPGTRSRSSRSGAVTSSAPTCRGCLPP